MPRISDRLAALLTAVKNTSSFGGSGNGDVYKATLGLDSSELANLGSQLYPATPKGSRHHRAAAYLTALGLKTGTSVIPGGDAVALALPQLAGLGVEAGEAAMGATRNPNWASDTQNDLAANWQGALDAFRRRP